MPTIYMKNVDQKDLPERIERDHYPTPLAVAEACLKFIHQRRAYSPERVLDIGAGNGVWGQAARKLWPRADITGVEVRDVEKHESYNGWVKQDFFDWFYGLRGDTNYDLIMGNPPYSLATAMVEEAVKLLLTDQSQLAFLLPSDFAWSDDRYQRLYKHNPPEEVCVLNPRIPFTKGSNPNLSGFYVWRKAGRMGAGLTIMNWITWRERGSRANKTNYRAHTPKK